MTMRKRSCVASRTSLIVAEQVAGGELEILEVDDRLASLRGGVLDAEALEQLLQKLAIVRGELLESRPLGRLARLLERRRARTLARERREIDEALGRRSCAERREGASLAFRRCVGVADASAASACASARNASPPRHSMLGRSPSSRTRSRPAERSVS